MLQYFLSRNLNSKQSVKLSILLTSKYFTNPKFVFMFDLISSFIESSITMKKKKLTRLFFCFLLSCKQTMKNSTSAKTDQIPFAWLYGTGGTWDKIELCLRYLGQDTGTVIVLCLGHCRRYRRYHYSIWGPGLTGCFSIGVFQPLLSCG